MTLERIGGASALLCAATYVVGFVVLITLLAPLDYGTAAPDADAVVALIGNRPGVMIAWNTTIYIINALALVLLVTALSARLSVATPDWAAASRAFGLIWAALVLGAGMIANVAVERAARLHDTDPLAASELWSHLHAVELGLGGGNEIAGGAWILCVSLAGLVGRSMALPIAMLGLLTGLGGLATIIPALGDGAGAVFGIGAIIWFLSIGGTMVVARTDPNAPETT